MAFLSCKISISLYSLQISIKILFYLFDLLKIVIQNLYLIIALAGSSVGLSIFLVLVMCS